MSFPGLAEQSMGWVWISISSWVMNEDQRVILILFEVTPPSQIVMLRLT